MDILLDNTTAIGLIRHINDLTQEEQGSLLELLTDLSGQGLNFVSKITFNATYVLAGLLALPPSATVSIPISTDTAVDLFELGYNLDDTTYTEFVTNLETLRDTFGIWLKDGDTDIVARVF